MNLFERTEHLTKQMRYYDVSLLKGAVFFSTLFLLTAWEWFREFTLSIAWYWYLILAIACMIPLFKKMFSDN